MDLNYERGFKRLTIALSTLVGTAGLILTLNSSPADGYTIPGITVGAVAAIWALYFGIRWIILGFTQAGSAAPVSREKDASTPRDSEQLSSKAALRAKGRREYLNSLWPRLDSAAASDKAITYAASAGYFNAGLGVLLRIPGLFGYPILGMTSAGFVDAAVWGGLAYGVSRKSRICAILLVVFAVFESGYMVQHGKGNINFLSILFLLWFVGGLRAAFYAHKIRGSTSALPTEA